MKADTGSANAVQAAGATPVAFVVFNRPRQTRMTFAAIRAYRPSRLFLIADGPRANHAGDREACAEVREIVADVDWPCEVMRDFSAANLGSGRRVSSGLDWVFSIVDRAIVLEDDCLASAEFFSFCDAMLERYKDCETVWVVSGNSYQPQFRRGEGSYYFSKYPDTWGWATWRRAWRHYQHELPFLAEWKASADWKASFASRRERRHYARVFERALHDAADIWDYQWVGCVIHGKGLSVTPNANLVKNIGFDRTATHTRTMEQGLQYEITPLGPIVHPRAIAVDVAADEYHRGVIRSRWAPGLIARLLNRAKRALHPRGMA
jgi:hypothetical protein